MSSSPNGLTTSHSASQSTKKRKSVSQSQESPRKKKRRHEKSENGVLESQETDHLADNAEVKKKKKKSKEKVVDDTVISQNIEDIELPDVPNEVSTTADDLFDTENPTTNGIHANIDNEEIAEVDESLLASQEPSCFYEKRLSLQLPIPAISLASTTSSLLSLHLAPLLLTYFPPAEGIVLSFSDPILSAKPSHAVNLPLQPPKSGEIPRDPPDETFARCADAFGVCWVWLTATFLIFRPDPGDELKGWTNVTSEGFVGLVSYNYFQTAIGNSRIPKDWTWHGPTRQSDFKRKRARRAKLRDTDENSVEQELNADSQEITEPNDSLEGGSGCFKDTNGADIAPSQIFRVVDVEMVPGHERGKWTLQIEGSLLPEDQETALLAQERQRFEQVQNRSRSRSKTPALDTEEMPLTGEDISLSQAESSQ